MANEPPSPPLPDPTLRFRLHALLGLTTAVAVLAALAGPYYRAQPVEAQGRLLLYWSLLAAFTAVGLWQHWRTMKRLPVEAGRVRYLGWPASTKYGRARPMIRGALTFGLWTGLIAGFSGQVAKDGYDIGLAVFQGVAHGMMTGGGLIVLIKTPTMLCENGIAFGRGFAPWRYIRHAEWLEKSPDIMKFRRLDGDLFMSVPRREHEAVETLVREKTSLIETPLGANGALATRAIS